MKRPLIIVTLALLGFVLLLTLIRTRLPGIRGSHPMGLQGQTNIAASFFGRAVDENGQPLAGVRFEGHVEAHPKNWSFSNLGEPMETRPFTVISDADGRFKLDVNGARLLFRSAALDGYDQLQELDAGVRSSENGWNAVDTQSFRLVSWGRQQYKSDEDDPAVFVFVKRGVMKATTLPTQGGSRADGRGGWVKNRPDWPTRPSLWNVDWAFDQPRVNVEIPIVFKAVDTSGRPIPNLNINFQTTAYRPREKMDRDLRRTERIRGSTRTNANGLARAEAKGFQLYSIRRTRIEGAAWDAGPWMIDNIERISFYRRQFMDSRGQLICRFDEEHPILLVLAGKGESSTTVLPCRGGFELVDGTWTVVPPELPPHSRIRYEASSPPTTTK